MRYLQSIRTAAVLGAVAVVAACGSSTETPSSFGTGAGDTGSGTGGTNGAEASTGDSVTSGGTDSGGTIIPLDGGSSTTGGDAGPADPDLDAGCGHTALNASQRPVNVLLVIDKSASMTDTPAGFSTDKWSALKTALASSLDQVKDKLSFGLELFPYGDTDPACGLASGTAAIEVPIGAGTDTVPAITTMVGSTTPGGGTPTAAALAEALTYFQQGAGASLDGDKYVLLATDGGPDCNPPDTDCDSAHCTTNLDGMCPDGVDCCAGSAYTRSHCLDDANTLAKIQALQSAGVKTIVVGIPGTEQYASYLDAFARAGGAPNTAGTASYFAVSASGGVDGLTSVLGSVTHELISSCRLQLETQPPDLMRLNVYVDGTLVPQQGADGWDLDTQMTPATVVLKGATCTHIESTGAQTVAIVYGCRTLVH